MRCLGIQTVGLNRVIRWIAVLLAVGVTVGHVAAQPSEAGSRTIQPGHGWVVLDAGTTVGAPGDPTAGARTWALLDLPPRTGPVAAERGYARAAAVLLSPPARLGSWADSVYLVFPPEATGGEQRRRVLSVTAVAGPGPSWHNEPEGRFESLPPLTAEGRLVGFAGSPVGPMALLRITAGAPESQEPWRLLVADGMEWAAVSLPWDGAGMEGVPTDGARCDLVSMPGGIGLVVTSPQGAGAEVWSGVINTAAPASASVVRDVRWSQEVVALDPDVRSALLDPKASDSTSIFTVDGQLVAAVWAPDGGGTVHLRALREGAGVLLASLTGVPREYQVTRLPGSGSLAVVWGSEPAGEAARSGPTFQVAEISVTAPGAPIYTGPVKRAGVISRRDIEMLSVMVVVVMVAILLTVLRPEMRLPERLPADLRIAEPARRLLAAMVDFAAAAAVAGWIMGVDPIATAAASDGGRSVISGGAASVQELRPLLLALAIAAVHCTIGEWLTGRSIGKALVGCRVIRLVDRGDGVATGGTAELVAAKPTLRQAAIRNLIRWTAPPVTVFAIADPAGRHPGDLAAGTLVVVPAPRPPNKADAEPPKS